MHTTLPRPETESADTPPGTTSYDGRPPQDVSARTPAGRLRGAGAAVRRAPGRVLADLRSRPHHELVGYGLLLVGTLCLYLYGLTVNGYANAFYSAAAQAGSQSWTAFFFGSSDAANAITVDKPPASLWFMALSVRLFGLNSFAILLPEVLMGVATVGVLYSTVRRYHGHAAGLVAGVVMALTPVAVLMFRFNNPDALLVLLLTLATWATLRATEKAQATWLVWAGIFIGVGFLTKTLQAFLILPVLGLIYLSLAPTSLRRRITHSLLAIGALVVSAGWWVAVVELLPASMRPYVGGSQTNSFLELTFGYNGLGRINGEQTGSVGGNGGPNWGSTGIGRMFSSTIGGQISWFIPTALIFLVVGLWLTRRAPRTDLHRASYLAWGGWLLITMAVFSFMAGIFHEYYTVALAPAIAALVGMGAVDAWRRRHEALGSLTLAFGTTAATLWSFILLTRVANVAYGPLRYVVFLLGISAALMFLVVGRLHTRIAAAVAGVALLAGLAGPAAYVATTVTTAKTGSIITAGPGGRSGGMGGGLLNASTYTTEVASALQAAASDYTWPAAAVGSQNAAGLQLSSGVPVMAIGGFNGSDPSPTLEQFKELVAEGKIRYLLASGGRGPSGFGGANFTPNGGSRASAEIVSWAQTTFPTVTIGNATFYDLTSTTGAASATGTTTN